MRKILDRFGASGTAKTSAWSPPSSTFPSHATCPSPPELTKQIRDVTRQVIRASMPADAGRRCSKDTRLCISLAGRPSNIGTRFHNHLYDELGLDFIYKAFTTTDIAAAIGGVRALGIRGCSVSMPFKEDVHRTRRRGGTVRARHPFGQHHRQRRRRASPRRTPTTSRSRRSSTNTVCTRRQSVLIRGSGGMANAVGAAFRDAGFQRRHHRRAQPGPPAPKLADRLGYDYARRRRFPHGGGDRQRHPGRDGRRPGGERARLRRGDYRRGAHGFRRGGAAVGDPAHQGCARRRRQRSSPAPR